MSHQGLQMHAVLVVLLQGYARVQQLVCESHAVEPVAHSPGFSSGFGSTIGL